MDNIRIYLSRIKAITKRSAVSDIVRRACARARARALSRVRVCVCARDVRRRVPLKLEKGFDTYG